MDQAVHPCCVHTPPLTRSLSPGVFLLFQMLSAIVLLCCGVFASAKLRSFTMPLHFHSHEAQKASRHFRYNSRYNSVRAVSTEYLSPLRADTQCTHSEFDHFSDTHGCIKQHLHSLGRGTGWPKTELQVSHAVWT
eukprot:jgi/Ulvmu1/2275/UM013_0122.1